MARFEPEYTDMSIAVPSTHTCIQEIDSQVMEPVMHTSRGYCRIWMPWNLPG
jgi:hypothetical protein